MPTSFLAGIFGRSPVEPLKRHMAKSAEAARHLVEHESKGREVFSRFARLAQSAS